MSNYEDLPCSIHISNQLGGKTNLPRVVEDFESPVAPKQHQQPAEQVRATTSLPATAPTKKKSCLSTGNPRKELPEHPALRRKTVAFGKTVNVSQTIEGTSRHSKKALASSSATSSPIQRQKMDDDLNALITDKMNILRKEIEEGMKKQMAESNAQTLNKVEEMVELVRKLTVNKNPAIENHDREKENHYEPRQPRQPMSASKIALARETMRRDGFVPPEAYTIIDQRLRSDPMFRQQMDDVLADAECDANRSAHSPPPPLSDGRYGASGNPLVKETLTVERSIRYGNGLSSIDSRQWTTQRNDPRTHDTYRTYEPEPPYHSMYQKGQSISYYPSEAVGNSNRNNQNGYHVEDVTDHDEDVVGRRRRHNREAPAGTETPAERERRIRQKYARKK